MGRSLSEAANYVLQQFDSFGISIPNSSRIKDMYRAICNNDGSTRGLISEKDTNFNKAREAMRDFLQLEFFFEQIANESQKANYRSILQTIVKDSVFPQDDKTDGRGRNTQAEIFAFAVCKNAGMQPIFEEPDVACEINGVRYAIAVKRIKRLSQFVKRVREGAIQIQKRGLTGFLCIDITMATNPENYSLGMDGQEDALRHWWEEYMKETVRPYHPKICSAVLAKGVRGIFLHQHYLVRFGKDYCARSMTLGVPTAQKPEEEKEWTTIYKTFTKGLPN